MKKYILFAVIGILLLSSGGYYYYTTTPSYSVLQIQKAIKEHDSAKFQKYVDLDSFYTHLVDDFLATQFKSMSKDNEAGGFEKMGQMIGMGMVQMMKPTLVSGLRDSTLRYVETGNMSDDKSKEVTPSPVDQDNNKTASLSGMMSNFGMGENKKFDFRIDKQGNIAIVHISFMNEELGIPMDMQFNLQSQGGYWRLEQFSNASQVLAQINQEEDKRLAAANNEVRQKFLQLVSVVEVDKKNVTEDKWGISKKVYLKAMFQSTSDASLVGWGGAINVLDESNAVIFTLKAKGDFDKPLDKGMSQEMSWEVEINQFMEGHLPLWNLPEGKIRADIKTLSLKLSDGTTIAEFNSYRDIKKH